MRLKAREQRGGSQPAALLPSSFSGCVAQAEKDGGPGFSGVQLPHRVILGYSCHLPTVVCTSSVTESLSVSALDYSATLRIFNKVFGVFGSEESSLRNLQLKKSWWLL